MQNDRVVADHYARELQELEDEIQGMLAGEAHEFDLWETRRPPRVRQTRSDQDHKDLYERYTGIGESVRTLGMAAAWPSPRRRKGADPDVVQREDLQNLQTTVAAARSLLETLAAQLGRE